VRLFVRWPGRLLDLAFERLSLPSVHRVCEFLRSLAEYRFSRASNLAAAFGGGTPCVRLRRKCEQSSRAAREGDVLVRGARRMSFASGAHVCPSNSHGSPVRHEVQTFRPSSALFLLNPSLVPRNGRILRPYRFPEHCRTSPGNSPTLSNSPHQSFPVLALSVRRVSIPGP